MSFDALARDGQGTENLRLLCRFGNGQEGVMGRQKIVLVNYSTHKIMTSDKSINLYDQSEAFQLVRGRLACLPPQTKQDKQREARR